MTSYISRFPTLCLIAVEHWEFGWRLDERLPERWRGAVMKSDEVALKDAGGRSVIDRGHGMETDDEAASVFELTGVIKWFDISKGYGFIVPDNGMPDVLLHVTCLRRDGFQVAYEGARVVVEVLQCPRGLQAFHVLSMDEATATYRTQVPAPNAQVTATSGLERATVKWFNRLRGFGFLTTGENAPDIFVHIETLRRFGFSEVRPGQVVLVRFGAGPKGLVAAELRPEGSGLGQASH